MSFEIVIEVRRYGILQDRSLRSLLLQRKAAKILGYRLTEVYICYFIFGYVFGLTGFSTLLRV